MLTHKQCAYIREGHHRWNFAEGAVRSGKSWLAVNFLIPDRIINGVGRDGINLLIGVSLGNIERNVLVPMRETFGDSVIGTVGGPDNTVMLFGQKCYCLGAEKATQKRKLQGAAVKFCYIDEAAGISSEVFEMLKSRLSFAYSECHAGLNPEGPRHWLKRFMDSDADIYREHFTIDDNPTLDPGYVSQLKREYSGVFYDRYILGRWTQAEGLVYQTATEKAVRGNIEVGGDEPVFVSIDYGITNPFAALFWVVRNGVAYAFDEYLFDSKVTGFRMTDAKLYRELKSRMQKFYIDSITVDPSASSFIEEIRADGIYTVKPADNDVIPGIQNVSTAIEAGQLKVCERCEGLVDELGIYCWDAKSAETRVVKEHDHSCDAMRYFVRTMGRKMLPCLNGGFIDRNEVQPWGF